MLTKDNLSSLKERCIATFVGCAVGDALGMPVEGWPKARIKKHVGRITEMLDPIILKDEAGDRLTEDGFGKIHHWTEVFSKGEYTDDTILTLAIAESIIERGLPDLHHICQTQLKIYQEFAQGRNKCGFGGTTKEAFEKLLKGELPTKSGVIGGPGTGPAMKMAPIGIWMSLADDNQRGDRGRVMAGLYAAKTIGQATHLDPRSIVCGVLQAAAIETLLRENFPPRMPNSSDRKFFLTYLLKIARGWEGPLTEKYRWHRKGRIETKLAWVLEHPDISVEEAHEYLGSSSAVYQAYPFVLWMFQKFWDDPIAGLEELVNCGGDCDTTGAIYGALVGARCGMIFPNKWTSQVKNLDYVKDVGRRFYGLKDGN